MEKERYLYWNTELLDFCIKETKNYINNLIGNKVKNIKQNNIYNNNNEYFILLINTALTNSTNENKYIFNPVFNQVPCNIFDYLCENDCKNVAQLLATNGIKISNKVDNYNINSTILEIINMNTEDDFNKLNVSNLMLLSKKLHIQVKSNFRKKEYIDILLKSIPIILKEFYEKVEIYIVYIDGSCINTTSGSLGLSGLKGLSEHVDINSCLSDTIVLGRYFNNDFKYYDSKTYFSKYAKI